MKTSEMSSIRKVRFLLLAIGFVGKLPVLDGAFPGIFPLLTTGWYYKPGPLESLVLGLIVVKILALRLGATMAGVPYHLNDIFDGRMLMMVKASRGKRSDRIIPLTDEEMKILERILLALRRIDSHDCFIRYICQIHQDDRLLRSQNDSSVDSDIWLQVFRLSPAMNSSNSNLAWNIYKDAVSPSLNQDCNQMYSNCPVPTLIEPNVLISGIF